MIKALCFFLIVSATLQSSLQDFPEKHFKQCEVGVFDVKIVFDQQEPIDAQFNAKVLKLPSGDNQRGWTFTIPSPSEEVKSHFLHSEEEYYLPYRSLTNAFTGNMIVGEGKSISTTFSADLKSDSVETHSLKIQFQYDAEWDVVPDADFNKIVGWLNFNRVERINYVKSLKAALSLAAANYVTNMTNSALVGKSKAEVDGKIAELRQKVGDFKSDLTNATTQYNESLEQIRGNENEIQGLKKVLSDNEGKLTQLFGDLNSQKEILNDLQTAKETNTFNADKFANNAKNALQAISGLITVYKPEAAADGWYLDKAFSDLEKLKMLSSFESDVRKALLA